MNTARNIRFEVFRRAIWEQLGDRAVLLANGRVEIKANEFSPAIEFRSLQEAIDRFNRFCPESLTQEKP